MVYVDNMYETGMGNFRGMKMSHMIADTTDELITMAKRIGVAPKWIQHPGTCNEHFDVCLSARKKAMALGAKEIHMREYARMIKERTEKHGIHWGRASIDKIKK